MAAAKPWSADECVEWTYERAEGDIVVLARSASEAAATIRHHGYTVNPKKLTRTGRTLKEFLADAAKNEPTPID